MLWGTAAGGLFALSFDPPRAVGSGLVLKWTLGSDPAKQEMVSGKIAKLAPFQLIIGVGQIGMSLAYFLL